MKRYDVQIVAKSRVINAFPSSELRDAVQQEITKHANLGWELHSQSIAYEDGLYICLLVFEKE